MQRPAFEYQTDAKRKWLGRNYDRAAWFYETSAKYYSGNQIAASKRFQLNHIRTGDRAVFLGAGSGEDALMVAEKGAEVTCVDISSAMLASIERKLEKQNLRAKLICQNALDIEAIGQFDVCCANYFLNVFKKPDMLKMLAHACKLVRPGGKLMIADLALERGNLIHRLMNKLYRKFAMVAFWALGLVQLHRDYDYCSYLSDFGFKVEHVEYFRLFAGGPELFHCIVATKLKSST